MPPPDFQARAGVARCRGVEGKVGKKELLRLRPWREEGDTVIGDRTGEARRDATVVMMIVTFNRARCEFGFEYVHVQSFKWMLSRLYVAKRTFFWVLCFDKGETLKGNTSTAGEGKGIPENSFKRQITWISIFVLDVQGLGLWDLDRSGGSSV